MPERHTDPLRARLSLHTALLFVLSAFGVTQAATFPPFGLLLLAGLRLWRVKEGRSTGADIVRQETHIRVGKTDETAAYTRERKP